MCNAMSARAVALAAWLSGTMGLLALAGPAVADSALDERLAELEATAVRGGASPGSKLTLHIYGQVNRAVMFWSDGFDSGTYVVDNATSSSRFGFTGRAPVGQDWTAGYRLEIEVGLLSDAVFVTQDGGKGPAAFDQLRIRQSYWDIEHKALGRFAVGFQSPATDDITIINLGSQMNDAAVHYNNAFRVRLDMASPKIFTNLAWGDITHSVDALRGNFVRYDTPIIAGFLVSAAANDEVWDVAVRYQKELGPVRFAAGAGYMDDGAMGFKDAKGSASLIHDPTGLYVSLAGGLRDAKAEVQVSDDLAHFHYVQVGVSRQWLSHGKTTIYVDYGLYKNFNVGEILSIHPDTGSPVKWGTLTETEVRRWGFGIEQAFDAAGLLVYAQAHFFDPTIVGFPCTFLTPDGVPTDVCGGDPANTAKLPAAAWQGAVVGARIKF